MSDLVPLEDMMSQLGEFGNYQKFQHFLHLLTSFLAAIHMLSITFTAPTPKHRCRIPEIDGTTPQFDSNYRFDARANKMQFNNSLLEAYIPKIANSQDLQQCKRITSGGQTVSCSEYIYDFTDYHPSSYVVEYKLVCEDRFKDALMRTTYLFGGAIGVIFLGPLADRGGRKPILCISGWLQIIFGIGIAFVNNYGMLLVTLVFYGMFASGGAYCCGFVLSMELVGISRRTLCASFFSLMFTSGCFILVLTAYFQRNAMYLQIILGCYSLLLVGHWWICDESIRWLWVNGNHKEAIRLAQKAARWNKIEFVDKYSDLEITIPSATNDVQNQNPEKKPEYYGLVDMFKSPVLRLRLLLVAFNWFANRIVYYGISFNTEQFSGNPYKNFGYTFVAEIPSFAMINLGGPYIGRRTLMTVTLGFGGLMCCVCAGLKKGWMVTAFSIFAKIGIAMSFIVIPNYTAEVFPTVVRNSAVGFCALAAGFAGMITPMLCLLDEYYKTIPVIIYGIVAIIGSIFCAFLPETLNTQMPHTMEDGETFRIGDNAFNVCCSNRNKTLNTATANDKAPASTTDPYPDRSEAKIVDNIDKHPSGFDTKIDAPGHEANVGDSSGSNEHETNYLNAGFSWFGKRRESSARP